MKLENTDKEIRKLITNTNISKQDMDELIPDPIFPNFRATGGWLTLVFFRQFRIAMQTRDHFDTRNVSQ